MDARQQKLRRTDHGSVEEELSHGDKKERVELELEQLRPLWVGGGMAFATVDRNYNKKINKKAYKRAMQSIFSALIEEKRIVAIDSIKIDSPKTKLGVEVLNSLELDNALFIVSELESNLVLSLRNIPHIKVISVENVDPISLLTYERIVIDQEALNKLEGMFS